MESKECIEILTDMRKDYGCRDIEFEALTTAISLLQAKEPPKSWLGYSKCCRASVKVGGDGGTHYYVCDACGKACDIAPESKPIKSGECNCVHPWKEKKDSNLCGKCGGEIKSGE
jgi:hypothetical protein